MVGKTKFCNGNSESVSFVHACTVHNHPTTITMHGKNWNGKSMVHLENSTQFTLPIKQLKTCQPDLPEFSKPLAL